MSAIRPNMQQFAELSAKAKTDGAPVVMLNLLKFKRGDGTKEYDQYGSVASKMVEQTGGRVLYMGRCDQVLIGDEASNEWDAIALVEYPSRQAFLDMVARPDYVKAHEHREAGLERTVLIATAPGREVGQ